MNVLRIIGHSHGANVASMVTRDDLIRRRRGLKVDTLVLLSPAVDPDGKNDGYHPQMENIGDPSTPPAQRRFFTFHPVNDGILGNFWAQNYRHTGLAKHETLHDAVAPHNHWSSTLPDVWETAANQLADRIRRRPAPPNVPLAEWPRKPMLVASPDL